MTKKQILILFICNLVNFSASNGLYTLLPVYTAQMGLPTSVSGNYLAFGFLSNGIGLIVGGWLSKRWHRRKLLLSSSGAVFSLTLLLMSQSYNIWQLTVFTAINWFFSGVGQTLLTILAALQSPEQERGKIFGILAITQSLGVLLGGLIAGPIADKWGYPTMLATMGVLSLFWLVAALFVEERTTFVPVSGVQKAKPAKYPQFSIAFYFLLLSSTVANVSQSIDILARPLLMDSLKFDATAIASVSIISGIVVLPLPPLLGWLGDRFGRFRLWIIITYLISTVGMLSTIVSTNLWHFWITTALLWISLLWFAVMGADLSVSLLSPNNLDMGMSLYNATYYVAGVIGLSLSGYLLEKIGTTGTYIISALLPLFSILLILPVKVPNKSLE